jgi:hypothetical protein
MSKQNIEDRRKKLSVPNEVHAEIKAQAHARNMTIADYISSLIQNRKKARA